jgi:hypothetical protein
MEEVPLQDPKNDLESGRFDHYLLLCPRFPVVAALNLYQENDVFQ